MQILEYFQQFMLAFICLFDKLHGKRFQATKAATNVASS